MRLGTGTLDTLRASNGEGRADGVAAHHAAAVGEVVSQLETVLAQMDQLGLTAAALHVSLGLELARTAGTAPHPEA